MDFTEVGDAPARAQASRYLAALRMELADLPRARRREIVAGISSHIDDAFTDAAPVGEADAIEILNHLGSPRDIASTARAELAGRTWDRPSTYDIVAVLVLLLGALVLHAVLGTVTAAAVGWLVGVVLLWTSATWRVRTKIAATLLVPLGLGATMFAHSLAYRLGQAAQGESCFTSDRGTRCHLTSGIPEVWTVTIFIGYLVLATIGPLVTAFRLLYLARQPFGGAQDVVEVSVT